MSKTAEQVKKPENTFSGTVRHLGRFFARFHKDYTDILHCPTSLASLLNVLEYLNNGRVRYLLHRYRQIEDIPEEELYLSLTHEDICETSCGLLSERNLQRVIPHAEAKKYIKTRFVRFNENGEIVKDYPCTGQKRDENKRLVNVYNWKGEDPKVVQNAATKQFLFCSDVVSTALQSANTTIPGPHKRRRRTYLQEVEIDEERDENKGDNPSLPEGVTSRGEVSSPLEDKHSTSDSHLAITRAESTATPTDSQMTPDSNGQMADTNDSQLAYTEMHTPIGTQAADKWPIPECQMADTPNANWPPTDSQLAAKYAHQKKEERNIQRTKKEEERSAAAASQQSSFENELLRPGARPPLPDLGEWNEASCYQLVAHYLGNPQMNDIDHFNIATCGLYDKTRYMSALAARRHITTNILFMRYGLPSWKPTMPLYAWHVNDLFDEMTRKSAAWSVASACWPVPQEFAADLDALNTSEPTTQEPECRIVVSDTPYEAMEEVLCVVPTSPQRQTRITEPLHPIEVEQVRPYNELEAWCVSVGLPAHFSKPISRLMDADYDVYPNGDGTFGITMHGDTAYLPGYERVISSKLAFSVPLALCASAKRRVVQHAA